MGSAGYSFLSNRHKINAFHKTEVSDTTLDPIVKTGFHFEERVKVSGVHGLLFFVTDSGNGEGNKFLCHFHFSVSFTRSSAHSRIDAADLMTLRSPAVESIWLSLSAESVAAMRMFLASEHDIIA